MAVFGKFPTARSGRAQREEGGPWPAGILAGWRCAGLEFDLPLDTRNPMNRKIHVRVRQGMGGVEAPGCAAQVPTLDVLR